ncbi:hypothetical protein BCR34DRAFT_660889 [Clohesyomyces aquaticus]|uniref:Uncharacterized protein n=1 Tax=Clohesyomyces aquaticus TaxID=1231657 RepID=A0A1Y2A593_9PLEO|nr:hypothetical protein BCR34DRAFT_660889 [Clohesyomyces aquaticus]
MFRFHHLIANSSFYHPEPVVLKSKFPIRLALVENPKPPDDVLLHERLADNRHLISLQTEPLALITDISRISVQASIIDLGHATSQPDKHDIGAGTIAPETAQQFCTRDRILLSIYPGMNGAQESGASKTSSKPSRISATRSGIDLLGTSENGRWKFAGIARRVVKLCRPRMSTSPVATQHYTPSFQAEVDDGMVLYMANEADATSCLLIRPEKGRHWKPVGRAFRRRVATRGRQRRVTKSA